MIEERHRIGDADPRQERFLKVTANSTSYGVLARFDRRERATPTTVHVYGPDGEPFEKHVRAPEDPGPSCFPPVAASITAGARLMLALLEHHVTAAGAAAYLASRALREAGHPAPNSTVAILTAYMRLADDGALTRLCRCGCGRPLPPGHRIWFEEACRVRARRQGGETGGGP